MKGIWLAFVAFAALDVSGNDVESLTQFFQDNNGAHWKSAEKWLSEDPVCSWEFIGCTGGETITSITMENNNATGVLEAPVFFATFASLLTVSLKGNALTATNLTDVVESIPNTLITLDISANKLDGSLTMSSNSCEHRAAPSGLSLLLSDNQIEAIHLDPNVTCLATLDASSNSLTDLPTILPDLEYLFVSSNNIKSDLSWMDPLCSNKLQGLHVDGNNALIGTIPHCIGGGSLNDLVVMNTLMSGEIPSSLGELDLLQLTLGESQFSGSIPDVFGEMAQLKSVTLANNFVGSFPGSLFSTSRYNINLQHNQLSSTLPSLKDGVKIDLLLLSENNLTGVIPDSIWTNVVRQIVLDNNNFKGEIPSEGLKLRQNDDMLEKVTFFNNPKLAGYPLDFYSNASAIPWMRGVGAGFLAGLDILYPVQPWALQLGASSPGTVMSVSKVRPSIVATDTLTILTLTGSFVNFPTSDQPLRVNFSLVSSGVGVQSFPALTPVSVYASELVVRIPEEYFAEDVFGEYLVSVSYENSDGVQNIVTTQGGVIYNSDPTIVSAYEEDTMGNELHNNGCQTLIIRGQGFADTGELSCRLADATSTHTASFQAAYINATALSCFVPHPLPLAVDYGEDYHISVSANNGKNWGSNPAVTFQFIPWCALHAGCGTDQCGFCACAGNGHCEGNSSDSEVAQPFCECLPGFNGAECTECADGHFGATCEKCGGCGHGSCDDGTDGDGTCTCTDGFTGDSCNTLHASLIVFIALGAVAVLCTALCLVQKFRKARRRQSYKNVNEGEKAKRKARISPPAGAGV